MSLKRILLRRFIGQEPFRGPDGKKEIIEKEIRRCIGLMQEVSNAIAKEKAEFNQLNDSLEKEMEIHGNPESSQAVRLKDATAKKRLDIAKLERRLQKVEQNKITLESQQQSIESTARFDHIDRKIRRLDDIILELGFHPLRQAWDHDLDLTPFTEEEKVVMRQRIGMLEDGLVDKFQPSHEEWIFVKERLEYISGALDRLAKNDWRHVAISTLISIGIQLSIDKNTGQLLVDWIGQLISNVALLLPR